MQHFQKGGPLDNCKKGGARGDRLTRLTQYPPLLILTAILLVKLNRLSWLSSVTTAECFIFKVLMIGRIRDLGRKYESGSQKRIRKDERETKSKEVKSKCKKISQFFPNLNEQLADPPSIQSQSNDGQAVEAINLESTAEQTFDTALDTESKNKNVNDVNESMQTSY